MENTAATPIHLLRPYTKVLKIKVRVCRIWRPRFSGSIEKYSGLRCILVDEMVRSHYFIILIKIYDKNN